MIVDAHHHFWDPAQADYPWMTDEVAPIRRRFGPEHLEPLLRRHGVDGTIVVQARMEPAETLELLEIADATPFVLGVVGWVDLTDADVTRVLRSFEVSKLVGIRHQAHDEPDPSWLRRPDVQRGIRAVGEAGLAYDFLVRPRELPAALETARALPEVRFVVDHVAKPPIRSDLDPAWAEPLARLSELENIHCKLSGLVTEADWGSWRPADLVPYFAQALAWFGAERCMFGSDWPVCLLAADYGQVLDTVRAALSPAQSDPVLGESAVRCYGLEPG